MRAYHLLLAALLVVPAISVSRESEAAVAPQQAPPKLVVILVADQLRADALVRYGAGFGPGGFKRLLSQGAVATGHYGQQNTYTGPGHATIATGSYGYLNGVMQNKYFDRATGKSVAMMYDAEARPLDGGEADKDDETSPRSLIGSTLGDELKIANPETRVVSVAIKGRGGIMLAGHLGTAYWASEKTGGMSTTTYYKKALPEWVEKWNQKDLVNALFGTKWERALPASAYLDRDDGAHEGGPAGLGKVFPHVINGKLDKPGPAYWDALAHTPMSLELEVSFALAALDGEQLGKRGVTDVLGISFSATDLVGHAYGPHSQEYQDAVVRLDRAIARLLGELDRRYKPGEVLVVFTADHGAVPTPEDLAARGMSAGRIKKATIKSAVNQALSAQFGAGEWVVALEDPSIYLDTKLIASKKLDPSIVEEAAARAALELKGVAMAYTRTQILRNWLPSTETARSVARSFHARRAGDVILVTEPFWFWGKYGEKDVGSTHGSAYRYDTDVPVMFMGPWVQPGRHGTIEMVDVAATIAAIVGTNPPAGCEGRAVRAMLK